jgi:mannosyl-3-phosphoglycerate phosphatase family protein
MSNIVIYTDLDGSLLDHHDYSHGAADTLLEELEARHIPVVPCTSKTCAELLPLRESLHNSDPFIVENGAAVFIPEDYFPLPPPGLRRRDGYLLQQFVAPRSHWLQLIDAVAGDFKSEFSGFSELGEQDIVRLTGLAPAAARRAARREFGEPVHWHGDAQRQQAFIDAIEQAGGRVLRGGRFLHVSGDCDKGMALRWLNNCFAACRNATPPTSIAIGDSHNDLAMLEAADYALIIRSPAHPPPTPARCRNLYISEATGPQGWNEGVRAILEQLHRFPEGMNHG